MRRFSRLSAVGASLLVPAHQAYENSKVQIHALTDGAIHCRSFGPGDKMNQYRACV